MSQGERIGEALSILEDGVSDMVDTCVSWGNLPDLAGHELPVAAEVVHAYENLGLEARLQPLSAESANAIGVWRGESDGARSLILNSHLDTEGYLPKAPGQERRRLRGTWRDDDLLVGKGLVNAKVHLVAQLFAVSALRHAEIALAGNVILTGVAQETGVPIDPSSLEGDWSGPHMGEGTGARWLVEHGVIADYALVGEPNGFTIGTAQAGYLRIRIAVGGFMPYTPFIERGSEPADNPNPFERAAHVVIALTDWAQIYEQDHKVDFAGGVIVPKAQVHDLRSGSPPFTERSDWCHIFLDVRTPPEVAPMRIATEVTEVVHQVEPGAEVGAYDYRRGYFARNADPLITAVEDAHLRVFGEKPRPSHPSQISMWQDTNVFNEAGVPSVSYGIRPVPEGHTREGIRAVRIDDVVALAKVYALAVSEVCGTSDG